MYIVEIIPLQKGIPRDTLSYFSMKEVPLGSIISAPLQTRIIKGIVISVTSARDMKSSIRTGNFSLRKIDGIADEQGFPQKILKALTLISEHSMVPLGTLITQLFPEPIFSFYQHWKHEPNKKTEIRLIQSSQHARHENFKTIIKEQLHKNSSTHIIASTPFEVKKLVELFSNTFTEVSIAAFYGSQKPAEREKNYTLVKETKIPLIICSTPQFVMMPRNDISACIIENYHSPHYVHDFTKTLDYRVVIGILTEMLGYTQYLADNIPSADFEQIIENRKGYLEREQQPSQETKNKIIITEKEPFNHPLFTSSFFSSGSFDYIKKQIEQKKPIFIFSARKSVATVTTCRDCGYTVECPNCASVMHLIKKNPLAQTDRVFFCHRCTTELQTMNRCPKCEGWNLIPLGVTQDALVQEINQHFPGTPVFVSNQDLTKTESACKKLIKEWELSSGVLIGNQKIIPHLVNMPTTFIASFEQCMSIPDYKTPMEVLSLFQRLLEKTENKFIVQTKNQKQEYLTLFKSQNLSELVKNDSVLRQQYLYPPFATLITIIMKNINRKDHHQARDFIKKPFTAFEHSIQSQFFEHTQNYEIRAVIHVPNIIWNNTLSPERQSLVQFLHVVKEYTDISIETGFPLLK